MEKRFCEVCTTGGKGCYMEMNKEINKTAGILLKNTKKMSEEEKNEKNQDVDLAVNNAILNLRDKARENGCKNVNSIVAANKWKKYL